MDRVTLCNQCQRPLRLAAQCRQFHNDEGRLHPTLDGICCPHCGAVNLFISEIPSWDSCQEALLDEQWESHHHLEDNDFYTYFVE